MGREDRPLRTGMEHDLPFHQLSPRRFEQLCVWLLEAEGFRDVEHYGAAGSDGGRDVSAVDSGGRFTVVQCKRYAPTTTFGVAAARKELDKVLRPVEKMGRAPRRTPERYVLMVTRDISADVRDVVVAELGEIRATFWDLERLDRTVRRHPRLMNRFFQRPADAELHRFNLPIRNAYFAGREEILERIEARFDGAGEAALIQAISGLGGVGKTQIAIQLCHRRADDYDDLVWCDASSAASLQRDYAAAARQIRLAGESLDDDAASQQFLAWLSRRTTPWLVVLDSADEPESLVDLVPRGTRGHVLVTTRRRHLPHFGASDPIALDVMTEDEAVAFLLQRSRRQSRPATTQLLNALGHLPLAIEQAGAFLRANPAIRQQTYLHHYREKRLALLDKAAPEEGSIGAGGRWSAWWQNSKQVGYKGIPHVDILCYMMLYVY